MRADVPLVFAGFSGAGRAALALLFLGGPFLAGSLAAREVHLSPAGSDASGDGTSASPFRSFEHGLLGLRTDPDLTIVLDPGDYPLKDGPIVEQVEGSLRIRGPEAGEAVLRGAAEDVLLELQVTQVAPAPLIRIERVHFQGGLTGLSVFGAEKAPFTLELLDSIFTGQTYQNAEVVAGSAASVGATARGNRLDGRAAFGLDLGTRPGADLRLQVEANRVEGPSEPPPPGSRPPRYGASAFLDAGASIRGVFDRNVFLNVPCGLLVAENDLEGDSGLLDLLVSSTVIAGDPSPERNRLRQGIYLALHPHHRTTIRFLLDTVLRPSGYGVYQEEPVAFPERQENLDLTVAGSIFWGAGQGVFSGESGGRPLPSYYRSVRSSIVPGSARAGEESNGSSDPLLGPAFEPLSGSPAIDALGAAPDPSLLLDARGGCRLADGDGDGIYRMDLGAVEREGPCLRDEKPFIRGDCSPNGAVEVTDAVGTFEFLFLGRASPACIDACDANDDGEVNITDGIYSLSFLFLGGPAPPPPHPEAGSDPTPDRLGPCR